MYSKKENAEYSRMKLGGEILVYCRRGGERRF